MARSHWSVFWFATLKCLTTPYTLRKPHSRTRWRSCHVGVGHFVMVTLFLIISNIILVK
ncbi:hypothetical protein HanIR_Chr07g0336681 [Helianthus annuus]|nr:hypothetical protein HanIR_Chr07g0336681 [Helianthus annuus]